MNPKNTRIAIILVLVLCSGLIFIFPTEPVLNTRVLFDDKAYERIENEKVSKDNTNLILIITHDDGKELTNNLTRVQKLLSLKESIENNENNLLFLDQNGSEYISKIVSPLDAWDNAFNSKNRSIINASRWADVLQPPIENGWCGENATNEENIAFQSTLLLLPNDVKFNVACPAFSGSSINQAPEANELLWLIDVEDASNKELDVEWSLILTWAEKISQDTEFQITPAGVNMLFAKSQKIAEDDLSGLLIPSLIFLITILTLGLRDWRVSSITIGSVGLIILAEIGILSSFGFTISIVDAIAVPIIMGVAVDGAFWYCKSSRNKEEVRKMLLIAMITTVTAISLALFSPIKAQRSLALIMIFGIILDWIVTRFVLEDFYLSRRRKFDESHKIKKTDYYSNSTFWPIALVILATIAVLSPPSVDILDVKQFLPNDDPALNELDTLQSKYILGAGTETWIVIDGDGDSPDDLDKIQTFQKQLSNHPSIISIETGIYRSPLILGIPYSEGSFENDTINTILDDFNDLLIQTNPKLESEGVTTGVAISVFIDGKDSDAAIEFANDVRTLLSINNLDGEIGGDLVAGAELAKEFGETRILQIIYAGIAVLIVTFYLLRSPLKASRIAIGTIAIGIAVDGMASIIGSRGVHTAPAVLLGMGFAADYLSHASAEHPSTTQDNFARWGAAISSMSIFLLLGLSTFPPARNSGRLLTISILFAVILATCLSLLHKQEEEE
ncbi:MAG: hypothetical protein CMA34_02895 [Euryarchaeota archaeon]|jgi:predicted RND superfamily exporter protein|nr:hypothetical protein [Euryarchaeota archaeon]|tara:strand:+ start:423 stop:2618 length:2196 start_codon:yes stop_codon:yes gene_type:complete